MDDRQTAYRMKTMKVSDGISLSMQKMTFPPRSRQMEAELTTQAASQHMRLARFREVYYEATWIELGFQE